MSECGLCSTGTPAPRSVAAKPLGAIEAARGRPAVSPRRRDRGAGPRAPGRRGRCASPSASCRSSADRRSPRRRARRGGAGRPARRTASACRSSCGRTSRCCRSRAGSSGGCVAGRVVDERQHHGVQRAVDVHEAPLRVRQPAASRRARTPRDVVVRALDRRAAGQRHDQRPARRAARARPRRRRGRWRRRACSRPGSRRSAGCGQPSGSSSGPRGCRGAGRREAPRAPR